MKINEIFGKSQSSEQRALVTAIGLQIEKWNDYVKTHGDTVNMADQNTFQTHLKQWAETRFPNASDDVKNSVLQLNPFKPRGVSQYINNMYMSNYQAAAGRAASDQSQDTALPPVKTSAGEFTIDQLRSAMSSMSPADVSRIKQAINAKMQEVS